MTTLNELYDQRASLMTRAGKLSAKAKGENRDQLSAEERTEFDAIFADIDALAVTIAAEESTEAERRADAARMERATEIARAGAAAIPRRSNPPGVGLAGERRAQDTVEYSQWFNAIVRRDFREANRIESRAGSPFSVGTDAVGGYLLLPTNVRNDLISTIDELCDIFGMVNRIDIGDAKSIGITKVTARMDDADWTSEVAAVTADTAGAIGRRDLTPTLATKKLLVSMALLNRSPDALPFIRNQFARLFGVTIEKALLTGSGSSQPLGIFTASASGISTARDVLAAATTSFDYTDLVQLKYSLKGAYHRGAYLFCHRDFIYRSLILLDDNHRPIFVPAPSAGLDDTILGMRVRYSEFAPTTYTAGLYVACYGDPRYITMADSMAYSLQFADQLHAGTNQVAVFGRMEADASPILEEAFSRLKLAAA